MVLRCAVYPTDRVPHMNDVEAWDRMCFGRVADADPQLRQPPPLTDDSAEMTQLSPNICSKIMALEQVSTEGTTGSVCACWGATGSGPCTEHSLRPVDWQSDICQPCEDDGMGDSCVAAAAAAVLVCWRSLT